MARLSLRFDGLDTTQVRAAMAAMAKVDRRDEKKLRVGNDGPDLWNATSVPLPLPDAASILTTVWQGMSEETMAALVEQLQGMRRWMTLDDDGNEREFWPDGSDCAQELGWLLDWCVAQGVIEEVKAEEDEDE